MKLLDLETIDDNSSFVKFDKYVLKIVYTQNRIAQNSTNCGWWTTVRSTKLTQKNDLLNNDSKN